MGIHWTCCNCEQQVEDHQYDADERMCFDCLDAGYYQTEIQKLGYESNVIVTPALEYKPQLYMMAWHKYCMESPIFRMFVKLGWRK